VRPAPTLATAPSGCSDPREREAARTAAAVQPLVAPSSAVTSSADGVRPKPVRHSSSVSGARKARSAAVSLTAAPRRSAGRPPGSTRARTSSRVEGPSWRAIRSISAAASRSALCASSITIAPDSPARPLSSASTAPAGSSPTAAIAPAASLSPASATAARRRATNSRDGTPPASSMTQIGSAPHASTISAASTDLP
jgi:hypothetical protein